MNGSHYYHDGIASRIVGGRQALPHSHPWQVLLNNRGKFCGGKSMVIPSARNDVYLTL